MVEVVRVSPEIAERLQGRRYDFPFTCYVGIEDGEMVGSGGLYWQFGRCWLWLGLVDKARTKPNHVIRWGRRLLRTAAQVGETEVCCERDPAEPLSARLLTMLGFVYRSDVPITHLDGSVGELWVATVGDEKWRHSPQLPQSQPSVPRFLPSAALSTPDQRRKRPTM